MNTIGISVISNRTHITLLAEDILYLSLSGRKTVIHITSGRIYETYTPIDELAKNLGSTFIRVDRCYLVSAKAIHDVTKTIDLINGESLDYARRRKREIVEQLRIERQKSVGHWNAMTFLPHKRSTIATMPALTICPLPSPTLKWCSVRNIRRWTGSSATAIGRWRSWKSCRWSS